MRKYSLFILAVITLLTFSACKKSDKGRSLAEIAADLKPKVDMHLDANDTIEVHSLVDHFIQYLTNKDVDAAVNMLIVLFLFLQEWQITKEFSLRGSRE